MVTKRKIKKRFGGSICRQCINKTYRVHLLHTDLKYELIYPVQCPACGEMKNIPAGFRFGGFMKLLYK